MMSTIEPDIQAVLNIQIAMMRATQPHLRGQHFKMHGCLEAEFEVLDGIDEALRVGLFRTPSRYNAHIRFSNGAQKDDRQPDIHGMAIKLLDVPGEAALPGAADGEQDFVLADNPVFFIRTAADYVLFMKDFAQSAPRGKPPEEFIAYLMKTHPQDLAVLQGFRQQIQENPVKSRYWSQVPYAFGSAPGQAACRYRVVPSDEAEDVVAGPTHDYLRERMADRLAEGSEPVMFDFQVQIHPDADNGVIDNPTVEWDLPFVTVASITIPPQTFDTPERRSFGEKLRYSPWQSLADHRPVGQVNEIRKAVYVASQEERAKMSAQGRENLRLSEAELREGIDDDFKEVLDTLSRTFGYLSHTKRGRGTHTYGAAGRGRARFIVPEGFPENDFFVAGRTLPVVLRHSSPGAREDDRARDGVAASLKFFDEDKGYEGPGVLDILMNAGRQLFVRTIRDFSTFVHASAEQRKDLVKQGIMMEPELIEAYRIRGSFLNSRYHTWQCFEFHDRSGVRSYIRFRLIPGDRGPERGLPRKDFRANGAPSMDPLPDDPRAPDFLRQDWIYQVQNSEVRYVLQGQVHPEPEDVHPHHEVLNPARAWNEGQFPWLDLCEIEIDEPILDNEVVSRLDMNPNRSPHCIRIPLATSPDQYASLGHARALVYPGARAVRAASQRPQNN
ncbi:catalase [Roseibium sp. Sym1]|uniref:catalase n=1 Tax=Roseibium sp. Sym1 TaxID=3016006 RepID=UPI0022B45C35|nr:catalase [Roseibium sp. Sym1]